LTALDWPYFGQALWKISDELGIKPEWVLPTLYLESKFDPSAINTYGCAGLSQFCASAYSHYVNVPVEQYRAWPASAQLSGPIFAYWRDAQAYGPIRSAAQLMIAQLGQNLLPLASSPDSVIFQSPDLAYTRNKSFDLDQKGYVTVQDIANTMAAYAQKPAVVEAISMAYSTPIRVPQRRGGWFATTVGVLALAAAAGYGAHAAITRSWRLS